MEFKTALFWIFSAVVVFAAVRVVTTRNSVHAALYLVLTFVNAAGVWMLLQAEFLALSLVLVYVGAVMVLFLFVVMMLDINVDQLRAGFWRNLPVAATVGVIIVLELLFVLWNLFGGVRIADAPKVPSNLPNAEVLGRLLYSDYLYPFELAAVLLVVAIVAAIALTLRQRKDAKSQDASAQVKVKASDRLRMVRMPAESARGQAANQASDAQAGRAQP